MELVIELVRPQKFGMDEDFNPPKEVLQQAGNGDFFIDPLGERRRGRWIKSQMHRDWADGNKIAEVAPEKLPGYRIAVDIRARKVRVFDPLTGTSEGEQIQARFDTIGLKLRLEQPKEFAGLGEPQLWVWLKWVARIVRNGLAEVLSGEIPQGVWERIDLEREWDMAADPNTGKRPWEKEPSVESLFSQKHPQKAA